MKNEYKIFILSLSIALFSCVPQDKYNELVQVKDYLEQENKRLANLEQENGDLRAKNRQSRVELDKLQQQLMDLQASFNSLNRNYQDLASRYNALIADNRQVFQGSAGEKQQWEEALAQKQLELENKEKEMQTLRFSINQKDKRVQELLELLRSKGGE